MAYTHIEDFKLGMDRRRKRVASTPGSCWEIINAHITRGGDIEARKRFVPTYQLPPGTHGLGDVQGQLYVFGSGPTPAGLPVNVRYQRLRHADGNTAMSRVLDIDTFDGKFYVIAEFVDGSVFHYYDGQRVTDWDNIAGSVSSNTAVANALAAKIDATAAFHASAVGTTVTITAAQPGVGFSISASAQNFGTIDDQTLTLTEVQENRAAVPETRAIASFEITGGTESPGVNQISAIEIDGVDILGTPIDWVISHSSTAAAVAAQINSYSADYTAEAAGPFVVITAAPGTGSTPNGLELQVFVDGDVTVGNVENMDGGVDAQEAQAQVYTAEVGGTFEAADVFTITLNGQAYSVTGAAAGTGTSALVFKQKVYSTAQSLLYFCALNNPTQWGSGVGAGFLNMANQNEGTEPLTVAAEYQGLAAVFSRNAVRIWSLEVDENLNTFVQTVPNTGTNSPRSVLTYGTSDVFYLHDSGIRSLQPRDSSNTASVNDVGTAIDPFVRAYMDTLPDDVIERAVAIFEPVDGRYWLALGERIFVFSYFPGSKVSAWSYYDLTPDVGGPIEDFARIGSRVYARSGDTIYLYGGANGDTYLAEGEEAVVSLPFMTAGKPATRKLITGFDAAVTGEWDVHILTDPNNEDVYLEIGKVHRISYPDGRYPGGAETTHFAPRLVCSKGGPATVSNITIHHDDIEAT